MVDLLFPPHRRGVPDTSLMTGQPFFFFFKLITVSSENASMSEVVCSSKSSRHAEGGYPLLTSVRLVVHKVAGLLPGAWKPEIPEISSFM